MPSNKNPMVGGTCMLKGEIRNKSNRSLGDPDVRHHDRPNFVIKDDPKR